MSAAAIVIGLAVWGVLVWGVVRFVQRASEGDRE